MDINCCIAMTAAELAGAKALPHSTGWMACHFSVWDNGLSNLPRTLPEKSVLIVDDSQPPAGHDPGRIAAQISELGDKLGFGSVILDFQKPGCPETAAIAQQLVQALSKPVCVAAPYAEALSCPVLVPSPAPHVPLERCLDPWKGRDIWLEATLEAERIAVTEQGSTVTPLPFAALEGGTFTELTLCCRYQIREFSDRVEFTLVRDRALLKKLLEDAAVLGVHQSVGLYQQLGADFPE